MIRRFIKVKAIDNSGERLLKLERIHSVSPHYNFDDAITLWDENGSRICDLAMTIDEFVEIMKKPIEIEI